MRQFGDVRRLRLASGLVLFAYLTTHFLNHALGLISRPTLAGGREAFLLLWRSPPGTLLLYGAVAVHVALALWALYRRRSFRGLAAADWAQLLLGLAVPPLIALHVVGTRLAHQIAGAVDNYDYVLLVIWVLEPWLGAMQVAALFVAWLHGCIGLRGWLRLKPWYPAAAPWLFAAALLLPTLAALGVVTAGREVAALQAQPGWYEQARASLHFPDVAAAATLHLVQRWLLFGYGGLVAAVLLARSLRDRLLRRRAIIVTYPGGRRVELRRGATILEASRQAGIPHAAVCGGRGRCSTCRVHVVAALERLPPASADEQRVLERIGAPANVRLACQTRPTFPVEVAPLLPATATPRDARARPGYLQGREQEIAILFADLRAFTRLAHGKLPYDTVFLLNRYFRAMGMAVETSGGHLDKFIGDGVMALFGIAGRADEACRQALAAARQMSLNLADLNRTLLQELNEPLRIGIGIHAGPAIVGEMGYARTTTLTAIGDAVNTASRLEELTKRYGAELVFSEIVARHAGLPLDGFARDEVTLRGRDQLLGIVILPRAADLPEQVGAAAA
jgi:adenylate cyclase